MNLISRAPLHAGARAREEEKRSETGGPHFDVKRGAPGPQPYSTRRYCYYEPELFLIIEEEPEVAACDTTGCRETRMSYSARRETTDEHHDRHTCVSPISAFKR